MPKNSALFLCVFLAAASSAASASGSEAAPAGARESELKTGDRAPHFTLKDMMAKESAVFNVDNVVGEKAKDGTKALLLSFFATWCEPCKKELPILQQLNDLYAMAGLKIILIAVDKEPDKDKEILEIMKKKKINLPVLRDRFNIVMKRYGVSTLPRVFIFNREGKLQFTSAGYEEGTMSKIIIPKLMELMGVSQASAPAVK